MICEIDEIYIEVRSVRRCLRARDYRKRCGLWRKLTPLYIIILHANVGRPIRETDLHIPWITYAPSVVV